MFIPKVGDQIVTTAHNEVGTVLEVHQHPTNSKFWSVKIKKGSGDERWTAVHK